ncbi:MAG: SRPBCC family protein [Alphaproteobacteria bacterium]
MATSRFVYVIHIRTTPEKLWAALIQPEFTKRYWVETWQESEWRVGAPWRMMKPDGQVADSGEVKVFDPPKKLVVTWQNQSNADMKAEGHSLCTYEIEPTQDAVKLTVTHEMDQKDSKLIDAVSNGWPPLMSSLKSLLETGEPLPETTKWPESK